MVHWENQNKMQYVGGIHAPNAQFSRVGGAVRPLQGFMPPAIRPDPLVKTAHLKLGSITIFINYGKTPPYNPQKRQFLEA